ncbi:hypothetical protein JW935_07085 [candidate division KSB1 bacterium]|nr:hypothetical protein [candidate division KSB1 bacterium]
MDINKMQHDIAIIKLMIEKTRQKTAASGKIFILLGLGGIIFVLVTMSFEKFFNHMVLPAMIGLTVIYGIVAVILLNKMEKTKEVKTYTETVSMTVLSACSFPILIATFLFPLTGVYTFSLVPIFSALFFGVMLFITAAVYEFPYLYWAGIMTWAGACGIAYVHNYFRGFIMIFILFIGFIVPGIIMNKRYRKGGQEDGA